MSLFICNFKWWLETHPCNVPHLRVNTLACIAFVFKSHQTFTVAAEWISLFQAHNFLLHFLVTHPSNIRTNTKVGYYTKQQLYNFINTKIPNSKLRATLKVLMKWNFRPLFYSKILKSMILWFVIFELRLRTSTYEFILELQSWLIRVKMCDIPRAAKICKLVHLTS